MLVACTISDQKVKGQGHRIIPIFCVSTPWLCAYVTDLLHTWYKCSPWCVDALQSISTSKYQRSRSHQSFEMKFTMVIRSFCHGRTIDSSFDRITSYLAYIEHMRGHTPFSGSKVKVTQVIRNFYPVRSVAPSLFHRFTSYEIHTWPLRSQCAGHHFQVKRSKVKVIWVIGSFCHVRSVASSLSDQITP